MKKAKNMTFSIPAEDAAYSGFTTEGDVTVHTGENVLVITPEELTVLEAAQAARSLIEVAGYLIGGIRKTCGECGERHCADSCPFVDTSSTSFAPPQAAGLTHSAVSPLPTKPEGRLCGGPMRAQRSGSHGERRGKGAQWRIPEGCFPWSGLCPDEVTTADYDHDISDIPPEVLAALDLAGVCRGRLDEAVMNDEVIRHD